MSLQNIFLSWSESHFFSVSSLKCSPVQGFPCSVLLFICSFSLLKLFSNPLYNLSAGAKYRKYVGHSAHVTNCRFSSDHTRILTTGGADHAVFQWRYLAEGIGAEDDIADQNGIYYSTVLIYPSGSGHYASWHTQPIVRQDLSGRPAM